MKHRTTSSHAASKYDLILDALNNEVAVVMTQGLIEKL
jgi:hypothetical protein